MYSPQIRQDLIPRIHRLAPSRRIPMTQVVDEILRRALLDDDGVFVQEVREPAITTDYQAFQVNVQLVRNPNRRKTASMNSPLDVFNLVAPIALTWDREKMVSILLNTRNNVLGIEEVSVGCLTSSIVHPRELFKSAILANATGLILVHNHPSGDPRPSQEDKELTVRLQEASKLIGLVFHDHIILGTDRYVSLKETGLL